MTEPNAQMKTEENVPKAETGAVLAKDEIKRRIYSHDMSTKIVITPFLSDNQLGHASVDVRLGNVFILFRRAKYAGLDVLEEPRDTIAQKIGEFQERVFVPIGEKLFLHPQQLVLGSTLEYVRLPNDLAAEVVGRSSWGRLGLILSAATLVHPGFAGVITLEMANLDDVPIPLVPGLRIAQLVFSRTAKESGDSKPHISRYMGATEPSYSLLHEDNELEAIKKIKKTPKENNVSVIF